MSFQSTEKATSEYRMDDITWQEAVTRFQDNKGTALMISVLWDMMGVLMSVKVYKEFYIVVEPSTVALDMDYVCFIVSHGLFFF